MNRLDVAKTILKAARVVLAMPVVYETINGMKFIVRDEEQCQHHEPHIHVLDDGKMATFNLRDGTQMRGHIKHEGDVLAFLKNASNRRRLLRRYRNWQNKGRCSYLVAPVNTGNMQDGRATKKS